MSSLHPPPLPAHTWGEGPSGPVPTKEKSVLTTTTDNQKLGRSLTARALVLHADDILHSASTVADRIDAGHIRLLASLMHNGDSHTAVVVS